MSSNEPPSTNLTSPLTTVTQPNITISPLPIESNDSTLIDLNSNMPPEAEPLLSSAQELNVQADARTVNGSEAAESADPSVMEWDTQTAGGLQENLLSPPSPQPDTIETNKRAGAASHSVPPSSDGITAEANVQSDTGETDERTEFTLFRKFPPELRLKVWKYALPGPMIVEIEWCDYEKQWYCPIESQGKPSGLLRANKESREVYLKGYVPLFQPTTVCCSVSRSECSHEVFTEKATTYFNPTTDRLYIGSSTSFTFCIDVDSIGRLNEIPWMAKVSTLACEYAECYDTCECQTTEVPPLCCLPSLKELIIVVADVDAPSMQQTDVEWFTRAQGELELVDYSPVRRDWYGVQSFVDDWYRNVPENKRPKLIVKRALRGGLIPDVVSGLRPGYVAELEDEPGND